MRRGLLLAAGSAFLYALQNLAMRVAALEVDPFVVTLFAGLPTTALSLTLTLGSRRRRAKLGALWLDRRGGGRRVLLGLGLAGVIMYGVGNPLFVQALAAGGVIVAVPSGNTVVIWSALFAAALLGERLNRAALGGIGVFLAGVLLLSWGQGKGAPVGPGWHWALPLGAVAGLCWSSGSIGTRYAFSREVDALAVLAAYGVAGLSVVAGVVTANGHLAGFIRWAVSTPEGLRALILMLLAGLLNLGAQITLTLAFLTEPVARASVVSCSSVAIVAILGRVFLGETLNPATGAGVLATFAGAALVQGQEGGAAVPAVQPPVPPVSPSPLALPASGMAGRGDQDGGKPSPSRP